MSETRNIRRNFDDNGKSAASSNSNKTTLTNSLIRTIGYGIKDLNGAPIPGSKDSGGSERGNYVLYDQDEKRAWLVPYYDWYENKLSDKSKEIYYDPSRFYDDEGRAKYKRMQFEKSSRQIKSNNIYDYNNCSWCGDKASGTLEYFLEKDGYDVETACDILDADPAEVVCEDCYKSIKPQLDAKMYSEYDDLGTDIRTGEPFPYPVLNGYDRNAESLKKIFNRRY